MGKALAAWIMVAAVVAARPATRPREVVESAVKRVIVALQEANRGHAEADRAGRPYDLERQHTEIKRIAAGLFDFDEAARGTLSRHWSARTPEERTEFVRLFTQLLERSYLEKIDSYSGEEVVYLGDVIDGGHATVRSKVIDSGHRFGTLVDYRLYVKDGRWRVYDVRIDGVSFVSMYRSEFDDVIQSSSYQALVEMLRKRVDDVAARQRGIDLFPNAPLSRGGGCPPTPWPMSRGFTRDSRNAREMCQRDSYQVCVTSV